ncbi:MAG: hypothetical protein LLG20_18690 [Acidobacteriales bacterium]|nr:hypothetical protein [Terriglobales bacterium]
MPELIVTSGDGATSPATRLPHALIGRWRAGESVAELSADYGLSVDAVELALEVAALREVIAALPAKRRVKALTDAHRRLGGWRMFRLVPSRGPFRVLFDSRVTSGGGEAA